jgi:prevent-host-death family protein
MAKASRRRGFGEDDAVFRPNEAVPAHQIREVQASVAKTHFSQLLDEVERGTTIVVLRHGHAVARIVPDEQRVRERRAKAIENIRKLGDEIRRKHGPITVEEIISTIQEGHKY